MKERLLHFMNSKCVYTNMGFFEIPEVMYKFSKFIFILCNVR